MLAITAPFYLPSPNNTSKTPLWPLVASSRQLTGSALEVGDMRDEQLEDQRRHDPGGDHQGRARARPAFSAPFGGREADEHSEHDAEQDDRREPAPDLCHRSQRPVAADLRDDDREEHRADHADRDARRERERKRLAHLPGPVVFGVVDLVDPAHDRANGA